MDGDVGDRVVVETGLSQPLELFEIGIPQLLPFGRMPVCGRDVSLACKQYKVSVLG